MSKIDIKRMMELERIAKNYEEVEINNIDEINYLKRVYKMPYNLIYAAIDYYNENWIKINKHELMTSLIISFHTNEEDLKQRIEDVKRIIKYKERESNNRLKDQKRMIKRLNNY